MSYDVNEYKKFVESKLSDPSMDLSVLISRLQELDNIEGLNVSALITASAGLSAEGGEFEEIVKKVLFQGKPYDEDVRFHLKRELGDALFYIGVGAIALGYSLEELFIENENKLNARFKDGFTVEESEKRKQGDL